MDTVRDLGEKQSFDALVTAIARRARLLLHADVMLVSLYDDHGAAVVRASDGAISPSTADLRFTSGDGPGAEATRSRAPVWTTDYFNDDRFTRSEPVDRLVQEEGIATLLAVPLRAMDQVVGVLYSGHRDVRSFTADEVALMTSLAGHAAAAIQQSRALEEAKARIAYVTAEYSRLRAHIQAEQRTAETGRHMVDTALNGGDAQELAAEIATAIEGAVMVRDENDLTVAHAGDPFQTPDELEQTVLTARAENRIACVGEHLTVVPVRAGQEDLGALIVDRWQPLTESDHSTLHYAAQAVAVFALTRRGPAATDGQVRDEIFAELLATSPHAPHRIRWAQRLGLDLSQPHVIVVARVEGADRSGLNTWARSYLSRRGGAKAIRDGNLVLLLRGEDACEAARDVSRRLGQALSRPVTAGGAPAWGEREAVGGGYQQALRCLEALTSLGQTGAAATADELGFVGLLLSGKNDVTDFVDATIGPVTQYDADRSADLGRTLEAYFAAGGSPTYAARALQVHPNTVARRLERISLLLGAGWQEPERALEIQLALRLQRVRTSLDVETPPPPAGGEPKTN